MVAVGSNPASAEPSSQPSSWCHLFLVWVQASLADTLHSLLLCPLLWHNFCLSGFSSEALLSAEFSTAKLSLHHHRGRTATTFTTNLVQEKDISAGYMFLSREIPFTAQCTFFSFSSKLIRGTLMSAPPTPFPPSDYGWILHSLKEKKNQASSSNALPLLHILLAFGSLQQIHKAHHTINLELQTFQAIVLISLPMNQEWVLSFLAESTLSTHNKNRSKTIHVFFEIVTNDKT